MNEIKKILDNMVYNNPDMYYLIRTHIFYNDYLKYVFTQNVDLDNKSKDLVDQISKLDIHQKAYIFDMIWCKNCKEYTVMDFNLYCSNCGSLDIVKLTENKIDLFPYIL